MINEGQRRRFELYEVLQEFEKIKSRKDKIEYLRRHNQAAITDYLRCVFDDSITFLLPEGRPPFTPTKEESVPSSWYRQNKNLTFFVKGGQGARMPGYKREQKFIGMLESVHPKDAEILVAMIQKKSTTKGLTKKLVQEAFPNLIVK